MLADLARPSLGDVALLLVIQLGLGALTSTTALFVIGRLTAGSGVAGDLLGAMLFGLLRARRARTWQLSHRVPLALWGTVIWCLVDGALLALVRFAHGPVHQLLGRPLVPGVVVLCACYFIATLLGTSLGSWLEAVLTKTWAGDPGERDGMLAG